MSDTAQAVPALRPRRRRAALLGAAALILAAGGGWGWQWWQVGRFLEETNDAYTGADAVAIAPRIAGYVASVEVGDNQPVRAGQVLARIDDRDFRTALDGARAAVAAAEADIANLRAQIGLQQATIAASGETITADQAALDFARQDWRRYVDLMHTGFGTVQRAQQAEADMRGKAAQLQHDRDALEAAQRQVEVLTAQLHRAEAVLDGDRATARQAELNLSYTVITAPIDGIVGDRTLRLGGYVQPGTQVMDVVPSGEGIYVVANFKETQLAGIVRGAPASISVDMLGGAPLRGRVESLAPGSGATFALLPPENATGNFTKIVQRVPVRIALEATDAAVLAHLRPGLSVDVSVDTRGPANAGVVAEAVR